MITSGKIIEDINQKVAILKHEINQAGKLGILNIHKYCENLVKNLLNITYDLQMINLNDKVANFPGIDIGDDAKGVAYGVSSEKTSIKVDEMLDKVIRFNHYVKFPSINMFMLSSKQASYTLNTAINGLLIFNVDKNIVDFDDWLKAVQHLPIDKLRQILALLEAELPYTINQLKGEEKGAVLKSTNLVDIKTGLENSGMHYFQHFALRIRLHGKSFSAPVLFTALDKFYEGIKKNNLYLFNPVYRRSQTAQQVDFYEKLNGGNPPNYFREGALRIQANYIVFEKASYQYEETMLTNLVTEVLAIFSILILFKQQYGHETMQVEMDFDLSSNGKLCFFSQNSPLHVQNMMTTTILNPSPLSFSKMVHDVDNATLNDIFTEIIHGFVSDGQPGYFFDPFLQLNEIDQNRANAGLKGVFAPSLKDLD